MVLDYLDVPKEHVHHHRQKSVSEFCFDLDQMMCQLHQCFLWVGFPQEDAQ